MDLDVILRQVPALVIANQQMGAQIADLLAFKADAEQRLAALEPEKPAAEPEPAPEPVAEQQPEEHASDAPQAETPAGEAQEAQEGDPAPTPAEQAAEASPDAPQAAEQS